jgi:glycyl-tRNA synthetase alpha subunit
MYRQGDVMIVPVGEIPDGLKKVPLDKGCVILAYGEVTGHAHAVIGDVEFLAADMEDLEQRFLRVEAEAQVVHEEHGTITLPAGDYAIMRQREYAPEEIRTVAD